MDNVSMAHAKRLTFHLIYVFVFIQYQLIIHFMCTMAFQCNCRVVVIVSINFCFFDQDYVLLACILFEDAS